MKYLARYHGPFGPMQRGQEAIMSFATAEARVEYSTRPGGLHVLIDQWDEDELSHA